MHLSSVGRVSGTQLVIANGMPIIGTVCPSLAVPESRFTYLNGVCPQSAPITRHKKIAGAFIVIF